MSNDEDSPVLTLSSPEKDDASKTPSSSNPIAKPAATTTSNPSTDGQWADDEPQEIDASDFALTSQWDKTPTTQADPVRTSLKKVNKIPTEDILNKIKQTTPKDLNQLHQMVIDLADSVHQSKHGLVSAGLKEITTRQELYKEIQVATETATEGLITAHEAKATAASASRQSFKMCLILSGDNMPPRSPQGEKDPKTSIRKIIKHFLDLDLNTFQGEQLAGGHYHGRKSKEFMAKFTIVGEGSAHEAILQAARTKKPQGFRVKICPADADSTIYFLLRCMAGSGQANNVFTARSGKPCIWMKLPDGQEKPIAFNTEQEVRQAMSQASLDEEQKRINNRKEIRTRITLERETLKNGIKQAHRDAIEAEATARDISKTRGNNGNIRNIDKAELAINLDRGVKSLQGWQGSRNMASFRGTGRRSRSRNKSEHSGRGGGAARGGRGARGAGFGHPLRGGHQGQGGEKRKHTGGQPEVDKSKQRKILTLEEMA